MDNSEKELREKLSAAHGPLVFATIARLGLIACKPPTEDRYLEYLTSIDASSESSGTAREQLVFDCLVHPASDEEKARVRRHLEAKPIIANHVAQAIEAKSCGDFDDGKPSPERVAELDAKFEFGWEILQPVGGPEIILATDSTAGALIRGLFDAKERGEDVTGKATRQAVLSFIREPDRGTIEALLSQRPALLMPIWSRAKRLAGVGAVELGKE